MLFGSEIDFLAFAPAFAPAAVVPLHATPVGNGTAARTERIPIHERAVLGPFAR